ncbi:MAG: ABC transporter, partial [Alphaproteobacteria bacterium]|nr:ABC transporter [Alphaproteobacteria bacterium]
PLSPEVARLVDLRNLFHGRICEHRPQDGRSLIEWAGHRLETGFQPDFAVGSEVAWVIPDGFIVPHRRDRPSRGEHENPVRGRLASVLHIGPTAHLALRLEAGEPHPLFFSVPGHVARRNGFVAGAEVVVSLLAQGIHLMPPRQSDGPPD